MIPQSLHFILLATGSATLINLFLYIQKDGFFCDEMVHLFDEENIGTYGYYDYVLLSNMSLPKNSNILSRSEKKSNYREIFAGHLQQRSTKLFD